MSSRNLVLTFWLSIVNIVNKMENGIPGVPSCLNMRELHGVAHGLDVAGGGARLRPEQSRHARLQSLAD